MTEGYNRKKVKSHREIPQQCKFVLAVHSCKKNLIIPDWLFGSFDSNKHRLICIQCISKYHFDCCLVDPDLDDIVAYAILNYYSHRHRLFDYGCNHAAGEYERKVVSVCEDIITKEKMNKIKELEILARKGDLIAFQEWKMMTGNHDVVDVNSIPTIWSVGVSRSL